MNKEAGHQSLQAESRLKEAASAMSHPASTSLCTLSSEKWAKAFGYVVSWTDSIDDGGIKQKFPKATIPPGLQVFRVRMYLSIGG